MAATMRILIGYDGSGCADAAVYDLRRAGLPADTEAVVFTSAAVTPYLPVSCYESADATVLAKEPPIIRNAQMLAQAALSEARSVAARGVRRVRAEFPEWKVNRIRQGPTRRTAR